MFESARGKEKRACGAAVTALNQRWNCKMSYYLPVRMQTTLYAKVNTKCGKSFHLAVGIHYVFFYKNSGISPEPRLFLNILEFMAQIVLISRF